MPSLKDLRTRINSVKQTRKITSAMKLVAASKLRRAQEQAEAARPYRRAHGADAGQPGGERRRPARARRRCWPAPARTRCTAGGRAPPIAACAAASTPRSRAAPRADPRAARGRARRSRCCASAARVATCCAASSASLIVDTDRGAPASRRLEFAEADRSRSGSSRCSRPASSTSARSSSTASSR